MFSGYLKYAGREIINSARTEAYAERFMRSLTVLPMSAGLRERLGDDEYLSPAEDGAPWYRPENPASGRFYGLYPANLTGDEDSTRTVEVTDLTGDGAVHSRPRYEGRELRFIVVALAADEEAMSEGLAWLRDVLDPGGCMAAGRACGGWEAQMFASMPTIPDAPDPQRTFYKVELLEGPKITAHLPSKRYVLRRLEFILDAGVPWAFTPEERIASVDMNVGVVSHQDPEGEDCSQELSVHSRFINDPYFTAISAPPQPPVIKPPNILKITSWRRRTVAIPTSATARWGRAVPVVQVVVGDNDLQQVRLRFYKRTANLQGCDYEAEYLISYLPVNSVLTLDAITKEARVRLPGSEEEVPGEHLLYGSDGLPFTWPTLACRDAYTMTIDMMPGNSNLNIVLDLAVRE